MSESGESEIKTGGLPLAFKERKAAALCVEEKLCIELVYRL